MHSFNLLVTAQESNKKCVQERKGRSSYPSNALFKEERRKKKKTDISVHSVNYPSLEEPMR